MHTDLSPEAVNSRRINSLESMLELILDNLVAETTKQAEFWRTLTDDPHGISTACYVSALDRLHALKAARLPKKAKPAAKRTQRSPK